MDIVDLRYDGFGNGRLYVALRRRTCFASTTTYVLPRSGRSSHSQNYLALTRTLTRASSYAGTRYKPDMLQEKADTAQKGKYGVRCAVC